MLRPVIAGSVFIKITRKNLISACLCAPELGSVILINMRRPANLDEPYLVTLCLQDVVQMQ